MGRPRWDLSRQASLSHAPGSGPSPRLAFSRSTRTPVLGRRNWPGPHFPAGHIEAQGGQVAY